MNQAVPTIAFTVTPLIAAAMLAYFKWRMTLSLLSIPALIVSFILLLFVKGAGDAEGTTRDALSWSKLSEAFRNARAHAEAVRKAYLDDISHYKLETEDNGGERKVDPDGIDTSVTIDTSLEAQANIVSGLILAR